MSIDQTRPHVGRIYDYILGGHHHFEIDRAAAASMMKLFPMYPEMARLNRGFLKSIAALWAKASTARVLDLGSGLPTQGHFNAQLPDAKILFSDHDPLSVSTGLEILAANPRHHYIQADLMTPGPLFEAAQAFFGQGQPLAIGFIGVSYLLPDEVIAEIAALSHQLAGPGSTLACTFLDKAPSDDPQVLEDFRKTIERVGRTPLHFRTPAQLEALLRPWRVTDSKLLSDWLGEAGASTPKRQGGGVVDLNFLGLLAER